MACVFPVPRCWGSFGGGLSLLPCQNSCGLCQDLESLRIYDQGSQTQDASLSFTIHWPNQWRLTVMWLQPPNAATWICGSRTGCRISIFNHIYIYITLSSTGTCVYILYKTSICVYLTFHVFGQIIATSADVTNGLVRIIPPKIPLFQL